VKHLTALFAFQLALVANGGAEPYTYSASGLPAGLTLNTATGEITGTPATLGHSIVTASAIDSQTNTVGPLQFSVDVISRLDFESPAPPAAEHNYSYSYQFDVDGATGTVTYAVTSGSIPTGAVLSSSGFLNTAGGAGFITQAGGTTAIFEVTATDSGSGDTLVIPCSVPVYSEFKTTNTPPAYIVTVGTQVQISSVGYLGGAPSFASLVGSVPTGLTVTPSTADHSAIVFASQAFAKTLISVTSTDSLGLSPGAGSFFLTAIDPNPKIQP
jgi:hypothetical protein